MLEKVGVKLISSAKSLLEKEKSQVGFSRLKSIFLNGQNYQHYNLMLENCKRPILGNIPNEIINFIIQRCPKEQRGYVIKSIQNDLSLTVKSLRDSLDLIKKRKNANFDLKLATKNLETTLSTILPQNSTININYVGGGAIGDVFKISIKDNFGNKLMHDRAIKIYETNEFNLSSSLHGASAEANSAYRLQHILGHDISRQNCCKQEYFDLQSGFCISQYADNELSNITSKVDFSKLGLRPFDFHEDNIVNGRIVDMGGIVAIKDLLDKTVLKYYKKIMNCKSLEGRESLIQRYLELLNNPKQPERQKIKLAIELAKKNIEEIFSSENLACNVGKVMPIEHLQIKIRSFNRPPKIELPNVALPRFDFPNFDFHEHSVQALKLSELKIPQIKMPKKLPKIDSKVPPYLEDRIGIKNLPQLPKISQLSLNKIRFEQVV